MEKTKRYYVLRKSTLVEAIYDGSKLTIQYVYSREPKPGDIQIRPVNFIKRLRQWNVLLAFVKRKKGALLTLFDIIGGLGAPRLRPGEDEGPHTYRVGKIDF
jgi:hypothetical protein